MFWVWLTPMYLIYILIHLGTLIIKKYSFDIRIKTATRNFLISRQLQPNEPQKQNHDLKERLNKAKVNANKIRLLIQKSKIFISHMFFFSILNFFRLFS